MSSPAQPYDVVLTVNYSPWSAYHGGGQKSTHMMAEALSALGQRVAVVYTRSPWEKITVPPNLNYHAYFAGFIGLKPGISSPFRWMNGITVLRKVKTLSGPKTLVIGNGDEASLLWKLPFKRVFIFACRNTYDTYLQGLNWKNPWTWLRVFLREPRDAAVAMGARRSDRVAVSSRFSLRQIIDSFGIEDRKALVVPNGIDPRFFGVTWKNQGQRGILFFGRLARNKGPQLALKAYAALPAELRNEHPLRIYGEGPMASELHNLAQSLGIETQIHFLGWADTTLMPKLITESRAVLLPSLEESFGNAILEALATGAPLVTTRVCAIPEVVGPHAALIAPEELLEMTAALHAALTQPRSEATIQKQVDYVRDRFSWKASAEAYLRPWMRS